MGYVLVEVPDGVHLVAATIIYEEEWKKHTKEELREIIKVKTEMTRDNLLEALHTLAKG